MAKQDTDAARREFQLHSEPPMVSRPHPRRRRGYETHPFALRSAIIATPVVARLLGLWAQRKSAARFGREPRSAVTTRSSRNLVSKVRRWQLRWHQNSIADFTNYRTKS